MKKKAKKPLTKKQKEARLIKLQRTLAAKKLEKYKVTKPDLYAELISHQKETGEFIDRQRKKAKLTVEQLSEKTGLELDYLQGILKGEINYYTNDLWSLSKALNFTPAEAIPGSAKK